jgi:hypothetical protein
MVPDVAIVGAGPLMATSFAGARREMADGSSTSAEALLPDVEPEQREGGDRHDDDRDDPQPLEDDGNDGEHGGDGRQAARDRR